MYSPTSDAVSRIMSPRKVWYDYLDELQIRDGLTYACRLSNQVKKSPPVAFRLRFVEGEGKRRWWLLPRRFYIKALGHVNRGLPSWNGVQSCVVPMAPVVHVTFVDDETRQWISKLAKIDRS